MIICPNCSTSQQDSAAVCTNCAIDLENSTQDVAIHSKLARPTIPGTPIVLADGEHVFRTYHAVQLRTLEQGLGLLAVTNARLVFYSHAKGRGLQRSSSLVQQIRIQNITGMASYVSKRFNGLLMFLVASTALAMLIDLFNTAWLQLFIAILFEALWVFLLKKYGQRGSTGVRIQGDGTKDSALSYGTFGDHRSFFGSILQSVFAPVLALLGIFTAFDVLVGFPGADSDKIISELGALISDLQTKGVLASDYWE